MNERPGIDALTICCYFHLENLSLAQSQLGDSQKITLVNLNIIITPS